VLAATVLVAALAGSAPIATVRASVRPHPGIGARDVVGFFPSPPTTDQCRAALHLACYRPAQLQAAYRLNRLYAAGLRGEHQTIVIVDCFGSPTIAHDLHVFDQAFGLPDPSLSVVAPSGPIPPFELSGDRIGWAVETTLDVEWAHAMAPAASIVLVETPVSETEGVAGFPEIVHAENYVIDHRMGDVISQSFGATEETFPSPDALRSLRGAFKNARDHGVSVLAASGDTGATDFTLDQSGLYPFRVNSWPSSDPLVTSVGGTRLRLDDQGLRKAPDEVWNDGAGAGGGGRSHVFARPRYQDAVATVVGNRRGTPDVSMSAAVNGGVLVYLSFISAGWSVIGGTSVATPLFAGVVALADQVAGHPLGLLNDDLYRLARQPPSLAGSGVVDITSGNNAFGGVPGFPAVTGYDLASGVGTVAADRLVVGLAAPSGSRRPRAKHPGEISKRQTDV
jgi:subtilase family serine protease